MCTRLQRAINEIKLLERQLEEEQYNIMQDWYPNDFTEDDDADKFFGDMPNDKQLWIWKRENKCTEEDIQGKIDNYWDMKAHEKMEEKYDV